MLKLAPPEGALRERGTSNREADTGCLSGYVGLLRNRFGGSDNAARDEALPALVLARKYENRVAFGDVPAAIHCLLRRECEHYRSRIANLGFNCERHTVPPSRKCNTVIRRF